MIIKNFDKKYLDVWIKFVIVANRDYSYKHVSPDIFDCPYYDSTWHFLGFVNNKLVCDIFGTRDMKHTVLPKGDKTSIRFNILPRYHRYASELFDTAFSHFKSHGIKKVVSGTDSRRRRIIKLLENLGFKNVGSTYWMEYGISSRTHIPKIYVSYGYVIRCVKNNEIETFRTVFNEAFSERPGFTPYTRDRFARIYLDKPYVDLTGYFVIVTEDGNIVGTVANIIDTEYARISSKYGYGKIRALGVLKNHRGKGLGKTLLLKSVYWHKHKGIRIIGLGVDSDNYVALNLYKSMGFKIRREFLRYEREI